LRKPVVLDASAALAVLYSEPGADRIIDEVQYAFLGTANLIEVYTKLIVDGLIADEAWKRIERLHCTICPVDEEQARLASTMIWATRPFGLSLGDRACIALAMQRDAIVYTTDKIWTKLDIGVEIRAIR